MLADRFGFTTSNALGVPQAIQDAPPERVVAFLKGAIDRDAGEALRTRLRDTAERFYRHRYQGALPIGLDTWCRDALVLRVLQTLAVDLGGAQMLFINGCCEGDDCPQKLWSEAVLEAAATEFS